MADSLKRPPDDEIEFQFSRSSGPGGQNVNKVNSRVTLRWSVEESSYIGGHRLERFLGKFQNRINQDGEFVIHSDKYRDQARNMADCIEKLSQMLDEIWHPPKPRKKTKPSRASKEKRLQQKKQKSERKQQRRKVDY